MITGTISGRSSFLDLVIEGRRLDEGIRGAIRDLAQQYNARLVAELRRPKGGKRYGGSKGRRTYRRGTVRTTVFGKAVKYRGVIKDTIATVAYRASAPGEAPAVQTGSEVGAIKVKFPSKSKGYGARIFADRKVAFYRHMLEFGTRARVQKTQRGKAVNRYVGSVAPRPVFSPLQAQLTGDLAGRVQRAVDVFVAFRG